ncbi:MAG TPA: phage/plasmid primase, P4 family [Terriglobales bacterium]|jgi:putative DNA primase/helicase|nr:phage/plasmid primase, P4 family [Terriglobales bacterium]
MSYRSRFKYIPLKGKVPTLAGWPTKGIADGPEVNALRRVGNVGIVCGAASGIWVLDVDGPEGLASLNKLNEKYDHLPTTLTQITGGGGRHYIFNFTPGCEKLQNCVEFEDGLDVRTTGGQIVAPGSLHESGGLYEVTIDVEPVDAPLFLIEHIIARQEEKRSGKKSASSKTASSGLIEKGSRNATLHKLGSKLRGLGFGHEVILAALQAENIANCRPSLTADEVRTIAGSASTYKPNHIIDTAEAVMADGFEAAYKDALKFRHDEKGWWGFENGRWVERVGRPVGECSAYCRSQEPPDAKPVVHKALHSSNLVKGVIFFCEDRPGFKSLARDFDRDPWVLGLPGGLKLDLRTGETCAATPADMLTRCLPVAPSPAGSNYQEVCPRWMRYLEETHPNNPEVQAYLKRFVGYCLTASTREEMILFLIGPGGAGKGTFAEILGAILGSYSLMLPMSILFEDSKDDRRQNYFAEMCGRRLVIANEGSKHKRLDSRSIKDLTGGGDLSGRRLNKQPINFAMTQKMLVLANDYPVLEIDDAMMRRVHVVPYTVKFSGAKNADGSEKADLGLKEYLKAKELDGILRWAIDGCIEWQRHGLKPPSTVTASTNEYFSEMDLPEKFFTEWTKEIADDDTPNSFTPTRDLFLKWTEHCKTIGEVSQIGSERTFTPLLKQKRPNTREGRPRSRGFEGVSGFFGIKLLQSNTHAEIKF